MKFSEADRLLGARFGGGPSFTGFRKIVRAWAEHDLGVRFDPEEPAPDPLPERLYLGDLLFLECEHGRPLVDSDPNLAQGIVNYIAVPLKRWGRTAECERILAEAVHRYNVLAQVRKQLEAVSTNDIVYGFARHLLALIDGKESS